MNAQQARAPAGIELVTVQLEEEVADRGRAWVEAPVWEVVERVQHAQRLEAGSSVAVVLVVPDAEPGSSAPMLSAAIAGLRGLLHSLALEVGEHVTLNLVVCKRHQRAELRETLEYLASDDASWVQGATLDLREAGCQ